MTYLEIAYRYQTPPGEAEVRAIDSVREDVRQGYVSVAAAAEFYGVVLDAATLALDAAATEAARAKMRAAAA